MGRLIKHGAILTDDSRLLAIAAGSLVIHTIRIRQQVYTIGLLNQKACY
jgi:hypothetical protein